MSGPSFEQTGIPITQGCFVPSLVEIGLLVLEKKIFWLLRNYHLFQKGRGPSFEEN